MDFERRRGLSDHPCFRIVKKHITGNVSYVRVRGKSLSQDATRAIKPGAALGWAEAPRGATFHWVRIDEKGCIARYHVTTPSFINWHGFHFAAEDIAYQDFPIIMATFGLSNAECDR